MARVTKVSRSVGLSPESQAIAEAAARRGISAIRPAGDADLLLLGGRCRQMGLVGDRASHVAMRIAEDADLALALLASFGLPTPEGELVTSAADAVEASRRLRAPVVLRVLESRHSRPLPLRGEDEVRAAFDAARRQRGRIRIERAVPGDLHRVSIVAGRLLRVARVVPPTVVGDGHRDVRALAAMDPRWAGLAFDEQVGASLARQGLSPEAIAPRGVVVSLAEGAEAMQSTEDATARAHPGTVRECERAARAIGLDTCGFDVVCRDVRAPLAAQAGAIVAMRAVPMLAGHALREAAERIVASLFPAPAPRAPRPDPVAASAREWAGGPL